MARVATQKAAKDYPEHGIKKGDTYYSWQLYKQPKRISKTRPRRSQLTGSDKLSRLYSIQESLEDANADSLEDWASLLNDAANAAREVGDEYQEGLDNMPESLQQGSTGEAIQEKIDEIESWAGELESAATEIESLNVEDFDDEDDMLNNAHEQAQEAAGALSL